ncbi:MAG: membrane protein required for colicin V production [Janthinobacterium sp.]|jgi:membrane protein required for colicin V production
MTLFDYIVLFVLISSVIIGTMRGLVKELLSLVGWIVAFVIANAYGAALAELLPEVIPGVAVRLIIAFVALFIGVRMLMGLLTLAVDAIVTATGLSLADRGLGSVFGLARGMVIVLAGVILCGMTEIPQQTFWTDASLSALVESGVRTIKPYLPVAYAQHVRF